MKILNSQKPPQVFSGKVQVDITELDVDGRKFSKHTRLSIIVGNTTKQEIFDLIYKILLEKDAD
jgi:hypothetical protein